MTRAIATTSCDSDSSVNQLLTSLVSATRRALAGPTSHELIYLQEGGVTALGSVSNVVTHSTQCDDGAGIAPIYLRTGNPYYCDMDYVLTSVPDFLNGAVLIKTAQADKGSDPADTEWICFDVDIQSTVYVLYDSRVEDGAEPAWLTANFADQHAEVAEATDGDMGSFEIWYGNVDAGTVCTGGNL